MGGGGSCCSPKLFLMPAVARVMETEGVPGAALQDADGLGDTADACENAGEMRGKAQGVRVRGEAERQGGGAMGGA